jgi:Carbohydrate binding domain
MVDPRRAIVGYLLLAALLAPHAACGQAGGNPVFNPGFEQVDEKTGVPLGWTPWAANNQAFFTLAAAHSGVAAALLTNDRLNNSQGLRCRRVPISPGKSYQASAWVKITTLQAGGFSLYLEYWAGPQRVKDVAVTSSQVGDWTLLKVSAQAPPEAGEATVIVYGSSGTVGTAYFDDVAITALP